MTSWRQIARYAYIGSLVAVAGGAALFAGMAGVLYYQVYFGDNSQLKKTTILARINEETTIYCLDEKTPLGSFFEGAHRRYVPVDEIPDHMINALVAAEDKNFFKHKGVDYVALVKAVWEGVKHKGHFRGASTLTQQTVKNIMNRRERSMGRKVKEIVAAQQLERMYTKKEILEFYLNQFHVAANGNGIGVAAKYYFNKDVKDLNLVEAAFIAGSVKAPSKYNPFLKFTKDGRDRAMKEAAKRKNYVLEKMIEQGWITKKQFDEAWREAVPFSRGRFRTSEVSLVQVIKNQLDRRELLEALDLDKAEDLSSAGFKVYTTLDCELQQKAQLAVRRNLSRLELILNGYKPEGPENFEPMRDLEENEFYYGKVVSVTGTVKEAQIRVNFGYPEGIIPHESLMRYSKLQTLSSGRPWEDHLKELLKMVKPGQIVYGEVKQYDRKTNQAMIELNRRPIVSGGMVALDKGEVRVIVSGFDTMGYNRAVYAKRMPGSVFKSVVFYGALQLGWSVLDSLDNERNVFPYQGRFYYPRPDHGSPYKEVSMIWAGAMSENLGSVWLTSRLLDKLNIDQFRQLMSNLDLLPRSGEAPPDYHFRVARATGVSLENEGVKKYQLQKAINDVSPDLVFGGQDATLRKLKKMWWGDAYVGELQRMYHFKDGDNPESERGYRVSLVRNNYLRMAGLASKVNEDWNLLASEIAGKGADDALRNPAVAGVISRFRVLSGSNNTPELAYDAVLDGEKVPDRIVLPDDVGGRSLSVLDLNAIWGGNMGGLPVRRANISLTDVRLAGFLPLGTFLKMQQSVEDHFNAVQRESDTYELVRYFNHQDFRIGVGLRYLVELTKAMGVTSPLEPVLSFPLGTNDVTAGEVAKIYQTFINGKVYRFYQDGPDNQLNFIRRIEDRAGTVLFEPKRIENEVAPLTYSTQMKEILRKVVTHGTGRKARGELYVSTSAAAPGSKEAAADKGAINIRIPAYGKTGTTNDYTNAYFAGFLPYPTKKGESLDLNNSYVLTTYAGYDALKVMRKGLFKAAGGAAALPAWIDFAKSIFEVRKYLDYIDPLDINIVGRQEWPVAYDKDAVAVSIDVPRGSVLRTDENVEEVFATTDISKTGETLESEFAVGNSIRATVHVPTQGGGGGLSPLRMVRPFSSAHGISDTSSSAVKDSRSASADAPPRKFKPSAAESGPPDVVDKKAAEIRSQLDSRSEAEGQNPEQVDKALKKTKGDKGEDLDKMIDQIIDGGEKPKAGTKKKENGPQGEEELW